MYVPVFICFKSLLQALNHDYHCFVFQLNPTIAFDFLATDQYQTPDTYLRTQIRRLIPRNLSESTELCHFIFTTKFKQVTWYGIPLVMLKPPPSLTWSYLWLKLTSKKAFSSAFLSAPGTFLICITDITSERSMKPLQFESSIAS